MRGQIKGDLPSPSVFLCFFDNCSLFTYVPLAETIQICANALYDGQLSPPPFPREIFIELMQTATSLVEFSFNDVMYRQKDGVAMGSPLGPALANIFVGHQEMLLFANIKKPLMYFRYVDDTFTVFNNESEGDDFFKHLNSLHPPFDSPSRRNAISPFPFLMCW